MKESVHSEEMSILEATRSMQKNMTVKLNASPSKGQEAANPEAGKQAVQGQGQTE